MPLLGSGLIPCIQGYEGRRQGVPPSDYTECGRAEATIIARVKDAKWPGSSLLLPHAPLSTSPLHAGTQGSAGRHLFKPN